MVKSVFFGTPHFAIPTLTGLIDSPHSVLSVITQPDVRSGRGRHINESPVKRLAQTHAIPILQPKRLNDASFLDEIAALHPDVGVVAAYGKFMPAELLRIPRLGMINVHASLLPKYRGAAPVQRAIVAGETKTGITIIRLVLAMDAGPILSQGTRPIGPNETSDVVQTELADLGAKLLLQTLGDLESNSVTETEQDHTGATFARRLTREDGILNWHVSAQTVHNQVRGLHPWPHASSYIHGARYLILRTRVIDQHNDLFIGTQISQPGEIMEATGDRLIVAAGDGTAIAIIEIQSEGRRPLGTREFLAGHHWKRGDSFGNPFIPS